MRTIFLRRCAAISLLSGSAVKKPSGIGSVHLVSGGKIGLCCNMNPIKRFSTVAASNCWAAFQNASTFIAR